jgi:hypothetical protein
LLRLLFVQVITINSIFSFWKNLHFRRWVPLLFIVACFPYGLQNAFNWFERKPDFSIRVDADTYLLANAVATHAQFQQTWGWWTGPWLTEVPYLRPLTMMGFWVQYHLFGAQGLRAFEALHWFYHGIAVTLLWGFFSQIAGRGRAALGVGLFALGSNIYLALPEGTDAFNCWKDSADIWHLCFFTASVWSFLHFLRRGNRRFWFLSVFLWFAAVAVK